MNAGVNGGLALADGLIGGNDLLALHVAAALRRYLAFELNADTPTRSEARTVVTTLSALPYPVSASATTEMVVVSTIRLALSTRLT